MLKNMKTNIFRVTTQQLCGRGDRHSLIWIL